MKTMTPAERGISNGYGGIWLNIPSENPTPKRNYKYERVLDWDSEDLVLKNGIFLVPSEEAKKKYFTHSDRLYKLVNPDGELFDWMNGIDPLA